MNLLVIAKKKVYKIFLLFEDLRTLNFFLNYILKYNKPVTLAPFQICTAPRRIERGGCTYCWVKKIVKLKIPAVLSVLFEKCLPLRKINEWLR